MATGKKKRKPTTEAGKLKLVYQEIEEMEARDELDELEKNNHLFYKLYNVEDGVYRKMRIREWIETHVKIKDKAGKIVPFILNDAQRKAMAVIYWMMRNNVPVRVIFLKARQMGITTFVVAIMFERRMRCSNWRNLLIAHNAETSRTFLDMEERMRDGLLNADGKVWEFKYRSKRRDNVKLHAPFNSETAMSSAEVNEPGHGTTSQCLHMSEGSRWPEAERKAKGVVNTLPSYTGTFGFNESTANGDVGWFRDEYYEAEGQGDLPLGSVKRTTSWVAFFAPWFWHQEYRWTNTYGGGREITAEDIVIIKESLDKEERWLLEQEYLLKGKGRVKVDYDQLMWRRFKIRDHKGDIVEFNEQYPSRPELAFAASGNPVYSPDLVRAHLDAAKEIKPVFVGDPVEVVVDGRKTVELHENSDGLLTLWEQPEPGEMYFCGSDVAEGLARGDWSVMEIVKGSDCSLVGEMRGHISPIPWGDKCAMVAGYFNYALLAFETYPAAHGASAHDAALNWGYANLYLRESWDVIDKTVTKKKGWRTDGVTQPRMFDKIRTALSDSYMIPSETLLKELQGIQSKRQVETERKSGQQVWKAVTRGFDDCHDAYAIAQIVRDSHYAAARPDRPVQQVATTLQQKVHARAKRRDNPKMLGSKRVFDGY